MHRFLYFLFFYAISNACNAVTDDTPHRSPNGAFAIHNIGDIAQRNHYFEIKTKEGAVLLSSNSDTWRRTGTDVPTYADDILWSSDSQFVLFSFNDSKQKGACVYSLPARKILSVFRVDDGYTVPIRWVSARTFIIKDSTPMGGKALGGVHISRKTYRIRFEPLTLECVYTSPTIVTPKVSYASP
jgi:hypothetical protein